MAVRKNLDSVLSGIRAIFFAGVGAVLAFFLYTKEGWRTLKIAFRQTMAGNKETDWLEDWWLYNVHVTTILEWLVIAATFTFLVGTLYYFFEWVGKTKSELKND